MGEMFTHCPAEMSGASRGGLGVGLADCRRRTDVLVAILAILIRGTAGAVNLMVVVVGGVGATGAAGFPSHGSEIMVMCGMATIMSCMSEQGIMGAAGAGRGWSRKERERSPSATAVGDALDERRATVLRPCFRLARSNGMCSVCQE